MKAEHQKFFESSTHGAKGGGNTGWDLFNPFRQPAFSTLSPLEENVNIKLLKHPPTQPFQNPRITSGFVYLGQFIAHDISTHRLTEALGIAKLNLQTIYGAGPSIMGYLYRNQLEDLPPAAPPTESNALGLLKGVKLRYRWRQWEDDWIFDFYRTPEGEALIADTRNDQNFFTTQIHLAWARFHNATVDYLTKHRPDLSGQALFIKAREWTISCYQTIIVHQYLKLMVNDKELVDDLLAGQTPFLLFDDRQAPRLMPEFSEAAFRIGHSQIRDGYFLGSNRDTFFPLFGEKRNLHGFTDRFEEDKKIYMDWGAMFHFPDADPHIRVNLSLAIDPILIEGLSKLPFETGDDKDLPRRDLAKKLPAGLDFARALGIPEDKLLKNAAADEISKDKIGVIDQVPLGAYLYLEAQELEKRLALGLLGSRILAEQFVWIIKQSGIGNPDQEFTDLLKSWRKDKDFPELKRLDIADKVVFQDIIKAPETIATFIS